MGLATVARGAVLEAVDRVRQPVGIHIQRDTRPVGPLLRHEVGERRIPVARKAAVLIDVCLGCAGIGRQIRHGRDRRGLGHDDGGWNHCGGRCLVGGDAGGERLRGGCARRGGSGGSRGGIGIRPSGQGYCRHSEGRQPQNQDHARVWISFVSPVRAASRRNPSRSPPTTLSGSAEPIGPAELPIKTVSFVAKEKAKSWPGKTKEDLRGPQKGQKSAADLVAHYGL